MQKTKVTEIGQQYSEKNDTKMYELLQKLHKIVDEYQEVTNKDAQILSIKVVNINKYITALKVTIHQYRLLLVEVIDLLRIYSMQMKKRNLFKEVKV